MMKIVRFVDNHEAAKALGALCSGGDGRDADVDFDDAAVLLSVGLTCVSVTMPARHPAIHWSSRESASVYGRKRHP